MVSDMADEREDRLADLFLRGVIGVLRVMPLWVEAIGVGAFIASVVEKNPLLKERLIEVDGKLFLFEARDIGRSFYLFIKDKGISVIPHSPRSPDVTMKGDVRVLMDVFLGKEDPDTVFFSRRLEISGDTAAAIHLKNILASLL